MKSSKVLLLGDSRVGKSSIVLQLCSDEFETRYQETLGVNVSEWVTMQSQDGIETRIGLWCCSGAVRYLPIVQQNYTMADTALLVYDVTSLESLQKCVFWRNEILRASPTAKILLVGNKIDTDDIIQVTEENGDKQAEAWDVLHFRVSCKTGKGLDALKDEILRGSKSV